MIKYYLKKIHENSFVTPHYIPAYTFGGILSATKSQTEGLVNSGEDVTVITTDIIDEKTSNFILEETINGVKVIRFKNFNNRLSKNYNYFTAKGISKWLNNNIFNFDIIHISDIFSFNLFFPVVYYANKNKIPYIIQPHGSLIKGHLKSSLPLFIIKSIILFFAQNYIKNAKCLICAGEYELNNLYKQFNKSIVYIPNGIKPNQIEINDVESIKKQYNVKDNDKIILHLGRLHPIKRIDIIIKTMKIIENENIKFFIVGPGEKNYETYLINLINNLGLQKKVFYLGPLYNEEKNKIFKISNLFILLSKGEVGVPIAALEAISAGVPVLLSRPASSKYVDECKVGITIDDINENNVAKIINQILENNEIYSNFAVNSKKFIENHFSEAKMIDNLKEIYRKEYAE